MVNDKTVHFGLSFVPAESKEEYDALVKRKPADMITDVSNLKTLKAGNNFLSEIDHGIWSKFEESLIFHNGGLGGFHYGELIEKLPFKQFEELLANFGIGLKLFCDRRRQVCFIDPGFPNSCKPARDTDYCFESYCPDC
ncbi:hypothetical protein [Lysinibacillus fusiformis]|uniref:hypothetical protein n=1 Tax=Lysinibacillus fusiformis TaxID=28031 RepID=UPI0035C0B1D6|nr:hypothetical protein QYY55_15820 [Lysinibacillus fusiformis]